MRRAWLLAFLPAVAWAGEAAPSWPKDAKLEATTAAIEGGLDRVELRWPAARDRDGVVVYRVRRNGAIVAVLAGDAPRAYGEARPSGPLHYAVEAADAGGRWSRALSTRIRRVNEVALMGVGSGGTAFGIGGLGTRGVGATVTPPRFQAGIGDVTPTGGIAAAAARVVALDLRHWLVRCARDRAADTELTGSLTVTVTADGAVTGARTAGLEGEAETFPPCVARAAEWLRFPASGAGGEVKIDFALRPRAE